MATNYEEGQIVNFKDGEYKFIEGHFKKLTTLTKEKPAPIEYKNGDVITYSDGDYVFKNGHFTKILTVKESLIKVLNKFKDQEIALDHLISCFNSDVKVVDIHKELTELIKTKEVKKVKRDVELNKTQTLYIFKGLIKKEEVIVEE